MIKGEKKGHIKLGHHRLVFKCYVNEEYESQRFYFGVSTSCSLTFQNIERTFRNNAALAASLPVTSCR